MTTENSILNSNKLRKSRVSTFYDVEDTILIVD